MEHVRSGVRTGYSTQGVGTPARVAAMGDRSDGLKQGSQGRRARKPQSPTYLAVWALLMDEETEGMVWVEVPQDRLPDPAS